MFVPVDSDGLASSLAPDQTATSLRLRKRRVKNDPSHTSRRHPEYQGQDYGSEE
jgi:hypothetical protein